MKYLVMSFALFLLWVKPAQACIEGQFQTCDCPDLQGGCRGIQECGYWGQWGPCDCPERCARTYYDNSCGCIDGQWSAPRGSLVLIDNGPSAAIRPILAALGETFSHEMIVQGPDRGAQTEYSGPRLAPPNCDHPIDIPSLQFGYPGMEKSMSSGAIYADMYGRGGIPFGQSTQVIWQQGDPDRANAIADALDARPWVDYEAHPNEYLHLTIRNGATSRYSLYQYMNIEGTHLGEGGTSLNNGSISSTFCAYAYALGGPPMIPFRYGHAETVDAANRMWQNVYDQCRGQHSAWEWFWISLFGGCYVETACSNAAAQVINCFATPDSCGNNSNFFWMAWLDPDNAAAYTISPDYLGGQGRFASLFPTTWSRDTNHMLYWNAAGYVCGCFQ